MRKTQELINRLSLLNSGHENLKHVFNSFQQSLLEMNLDHFPVKGIAFENVSTTRSYINFLDSKYGISFTTCGIGDSLFGEIAISRIYSDHESKVLSSIIFDAQSVVRDNDENLALSNSSDCIRLALTWLNDEVYS
jgi:hypothetical protein